MPYEKEGIKYPRCTQIIGDCTDKSGALIQWGANCVVEWIRDNCDKFYNEYEEGTQDKTYIIDDYALNQARFAYKTVSDKALDVGSEVHRLVEHFLQWKLDGKGLWSRKIPKKEKVEVTNAFNAFYKWQEEHNLKPIELEKTVYGSRWAGTLDFYGYFDDKLYVIDWKTSKPKNKKTGKGIYPEMRYQVAAYRSARTYLPTEKPKDFDEHAAKEAKRLSNPIEGCGVLRLDKETGMPDWNDTSKSYERDLRVFNRMVDLYFERHPRVAKRFEGIIPF